MATLLPFFSTFCSLDQSEQNERLYQLICPECHEGITLCQNSCFESEIFSESRDHCGSCGNKCPATSACIDGECKGDCVKYKIKLLRARKREMTL